MVAKPETYHVPTGIGLTTEQREWVDALAKASKRSRSEVVREAINLFRHRYIEECANAERPA